MNHQVKKRFGQNFLRDKNLLKKIVTSSHIEDKDVIEIGPGQGALTQFLVEHAKSLIAYEIDKSLKPFLDRFEVLDHVEIRYEDFMDTTLPLGQYHVVANVPYYITTPILFKLLESEQIKTASLMIQKEVCDRLLAEPNTKAYNALSIMVQYYAKAKRMMTVNRKLFYPVPNVDSAVLRIEKYDERPLKDKQEQLFFKIVKAAFKQKRKTLVNNLHQGFDISKSDIKSFLVSINLKENIRAEQIDMKTFIEIAKVWPYDC